MQNHLYLLEHELKVSIINNRNKHFTKNNVTTHLIKMDKDSIEEKLFSNLVIEPAKAV